MGIENKKGNKEKNRITDKIYGETEYKRNTVKEIKS